MRVHTLGELEEAHMVDPIASLSAEAGMTPEEVSRRKDFLEFRDDDVGRLKDNNELAKQYADGIIEEFYQHVLSHPESAAFFQDPAVLERVKALQVRYFLELTAGVYDAGYVEDRLKIGAVHERAHLPIQLYLGLYAFYLRAVAARLREAYKGDEARIMDTYLSLQKLVFFDIGLAMQTYLLRRERTIRQQEQAMRDLDTPVLQLRQGLLLLPLVGPVGAERAGRFTDQLLSAIRENRSHVVIIDITGVPAVDEGVAVYLLRTVEASRLSGARTIVSGISAAVAQTLVAIKVGLGGLETTTDLRSAIEAAEQFLGYRVTRDGRLSQAPAGP